MEDKITSKKVMTVHDCEICDKRFRSKSGLAYHINTVHGGKKLSLKCKDCSALYTTKKGLTKHNASNHEGISPSSVRFVMLDML